MIREGRLNIHEALEPLLVDIDTVGQYPENPRNGDIEAIAESMEMNGMYRPVYVQHSTGHILGGNHTYAAALMLGATRIPVVRLDVDEDTARRIVLADNRTADLGGYDNGILVNLLIQMEDTTGLMGTGYGEEDLEQLKALAETEADFDDVASWPTISLTVPPHLRDAFFAMTHHADNDKDRLESLLIRAGWSK